MENIPFGDKKKKKKAFSLGRSSCGLFLSPGLCHGVAEGNVIVVWHDLEKLLGIPWDPPPMVPAPTWGPVLSDLDSGEIKEGERMSNGNRKRRNFMRKIENAVLNSSWQVCTANVSFFELLITF